MPGAAGLVATADTSRIEAPITMKAYLMCAFASFGGIFFGYDSGWVNSVLSTPYVIQTFTGIPPPDTSLDPNSDLYQKQVKAFTIDAANTSLIVSILSAGTFFGAIIAGDCADFFGRRLTVIIGCVLFLIGAILETAWDATSTELGLIVVGRLVAGGGVGFVSAIIILYMSEIAPKSVRGAIVSGYQFCITIGIFLANCVTYATQNRPDTGAARIPIAVQMLWALILGSGLMLLPESPRFYVKRGKIEAARQTLARLRSQPPESEYVEQELSEIIANHEYELKLIPSSSWFGSWMNCFRGSLRNPNSNLRRTILGTSMQMMQQWTGVNFIFYYGTGFFKNLGTIQNPFLISLVTTLVNVCSTPISFWTVEHLGRRMILIYGAIGMCICEFIVAIMGTATANANGVSPAPVTSAMIAFICIYIFFFASTWGPAAWVVIGEIFPLPIRARGVALSTASNWLWNCVSYCLIFLHVLC